MSNRTCTWCGHQDIPEDDICPDCTAKFEFGLLPDVNMMSGDERAAELEKYNVLEVPFCMLCSRINELVGRLVFLYEMAGYENWNALVEEARSQNHPSMKEQLDKMPVEKRIIIKQDENGIEVLTGEIADDDDAAKPDAPELN